MNSTILNDVKNVLEFINSTKIEEFTFKCDDYELQVKKSIENNRGLTVLPNYHEPVLVQRKEPDEDLNSITVTSPLVGQFFLQQDPQDAPLIEVGSVVSEGDVLCVIECMKIMNEVKSKQSGTVKNIYVENGCTVEFGQRLLEIA